MKAFSYFNVEDPRISRSTPTITYKIPTIFNIVNIYKEKEIQNYNQIFTYYTSQEARNLFNILR